MSKQTKVKVVVRVRPALKTDSKTCLEAEGNSIHIINHRNKAENLQYEFCTVYNDTSTQQKIFSECVEPLLSNAFDGQNVSVFAYGPTGAGKTHTMLGVLADPGIIPRTVKTLFRMISEETSQAEADNVTPPKTTVKFSYMEIYNEKVQDLLKAGNSDLPIREDSQHNILIPGLTENLIQDFDDFKNSFQPASSNRTVAATKLNEYSSRSHSLLNIKIERRKGGKIYRGKVYLIDLAGSEDNRRTGNQGIRMKESAAINKSLFVLGEVVDAINHNQIRIPYRNSKLTRLLQDSIGGTCHSVMITNIAPEQHYYYDTYCTLNFATKSKKIVNVNTAYVKPLAVKPTAQLRPTKRRSDGESPSEEPKRPRKSSMQRSTSAIELPSPMRRHQAEFEAKVQNKLEQMERMMQGIKSTQDLAAVNILKEEIAAAVSTNKPTATATMSSSQSTSSLQSLPAVPSPDRRMTFVVEQPKRRSRSSSVSKLPISSQQTAAGGSVSSATTTLSEASAKRRRSSSVSRLPISARRNSIGCPTPLAKRRRSSVAAGLSDRNAEKPLPVKVTTRDNLAETSDSAHSSPNVICPTPQATALAQADCTDSLTDKTNLLYQRFLKGQGKQRSKPDLIKNIAAMTEPSHSPLFPGEKISKKKKKNLVVTNSPGWSENEKPVPRKDSKTKVSVADSPATRKLKEAPNKFNNDKQLSKNMEFLDTLNTADVKELQQLQKVGVKRAQLIFDYRTLNGPFDFVDDLIEVPTFTAKFIQSLLRSNLVTPQDDNSL